jgi:hypothetical protein
VTDMQFHPIADVFPLMDGEKFAELVQSIKENGQREPIMTFNDLILDGRNRYRACQAADTGLTATAPPSRRLAPREKCHRAVGPSMECPRASVPVDEGGPVSMKPRDLAAL